MPSSRQLADPAWKTYKNRKKTLRKRVQAGTLSPEKYNYLRDQAYQSYKEGGTTTDQVRLAEAYQTYESWIAAGGEPVWDGPCHELCMAAQAVGCTCKCEGVNHGVASGYSGSVRVSHRTRLVWRICAKCGKDYGAKNLLGKYCPRCRR